MSDSITKRCYKCKRVLSATSENFSHDKRNGDGFSRRCKECDRAKCLRYYYAHAEQMQENSNRYHRTHKSELQEYMRRYRLEHADKIREDTKKYRTQQKYIDKKRETDKRYHHEHPESHNKANARWRKKNPDKSLAGVHRRLARKRALPATLTIAEWEQIKAEWGFSCAYCGKAWWELDRPLEQEHVIPLTQNGPYSADNIVPACKQCNVKKKDRTPEQAGMKLREKHI